MKNGRWQKCSRRGLWKKNSEGEDYASTRRCQLTTVQTGGGNSRAPRGGQGPWSNMDVEKKKPSKGRKKNERGGRAAEVASAPEPQHRAKCSERTDKTARGGDPGGRRERTSPTVSARNPGKGNRCRRLALGMSKTETWQKKKTDSKSGTQPKDPASPTQLSGGKERRRWKKPVGTDISASKKSPATGRKKNSDSTQENASSSAVKLNNQQRSNTGARERKKRIGKTVPMSSSRAKVDGGKAIKNS